MRYAVLAGNGRFPMLALENARKLGHDVVAIGIRGEASPEIETLADQAHWITIGELGKLIDILKRAGITELMMTGQVKHVSIFSSLRPDWRLVKLLASLKEKNTAALIGGVAKVLADEGIHLVDSTTLLKPLLAGAGVLTRRKPTAAEEKDARYGRRIAHALASVDVGQSVAVSERACVAIEAMEGTDATILRAGTLLESGNALAGASTLSRELTVVKVAKPNQDMRFDVPVIGQKTIEVMRQAGATCLALDAGKCLLIDGPAIPEMANACDISIVADVL